MHSTIKFSLRLLRTNIQATLSLRGSFLLQAGFMLLNNLIFFSVWLIFFRKFPEIRGWRLHDVAALYGIVAGSFGISMLVGGGVRFLAQKIVDGELDTFLAQPKSTLLYVIVSHSFPSGWGDMISGIGLILFSGYATPTQLPIIFMLYVGVVLLFIAAMVLINSLAFWLGNMDSFGRQLLEFLVTFSVYPQVIFSGYIKIVLFTLIPAGFIGYLPVEILRNFTWLKLGAFLTGVAAYSSLAYFVFYAGLKRYESGNRLGLRT